MLRTHPVRFLLAAVLPLFFVVSACDSGGSNEEPDNHEFQLDITPLSSQSTQKVTTGADEDTTLNGYSFYQNPPASQSPGDRNVFLIYLNENETLEERRNQEGLLGFAKSIGGRPGAGEHPITDASSDAYQNGEAFIFELYYDYGAVLEGDIEGLVYYSMIDGTITIEGGGSRSVTGSVDAVAEAIRYVNPDSTTGYEIIRDTTRVSGEFQARDADTFLPFPSGSPEPYADIGAPQTPRLQR